MLRHLDDSARSVYLAKLFEMCVEELFDRSYFWYPAKPPHIPRYMEKLPRTGNAEQLLKMIVGVYGAEQEITDAEEKVLKNEYQQYSRDQFKQLSQIFSGFEEDLV